MSVPYPSPYEEEQARRGLPGCLLALLCCLAIDALAVALAVRIWLWAASLAG